MGDLVPHLFLTCIALVTTIVVVKGKRANGSFSKPKLLCLRYKNSLERIQINRSSQRQLEQRERIVRTMDFRGDHAVCIQICIRHVIDDDDVHADFASVGPVSE